MPMTPQQWYFQQMMKLGNGLFSPSPSPGVGGAGAQPSPTLPPPPGLPSTPAPNFRPEAATAFGGDVTGAVDRTAAGSGYPSIFDVPTSTAQLAPGGPGGQGIRQSDVNQAIQTQPNVDVPPDIPAVAPPDQFQNLLQSYLNDPSGFLASNEPAGQVVSPGGQQFPPPSQNWPYTYNVGDPISPVPSQVTPGGGVSDTGGVYPVPPGTFDPQLTLDQSLTAPITGDPTGDTSAPAAVQTPQGFTQDEWNAVMGIPMPTADLFAPSTEPPWAAGTTTPAEGGTPPFLGPEGQPMVDPQGNPVAGLNLSPNDLAANFNFNGQPAIYPPQGGNFITDAAGNLVDAAGNIMHAAGSFFTDAAGNTIDAAGNIIQAAGNAVGNFARNTFGPLFAPQNFTNVAGFPQGSAPWAYGQNPSGIWGNAGNFNVSGESISAGQQAMAFASNVAGQGLVGSGETPESHGLHGGGGPRLSAQGNWVRFGPYSPPMPYAQYVAMYGVPAQWGGGGAGGRVGGSVTGGPPVKGL